MRSKKIFWKFLSFTVDQTKVGANVDCARRVQRVENDSVSDRSFYCKKENALKCRKFMLATVAIFLAATQNFSDGNAASTKTQMCARRGRRHRGSRLLAVKTDKRAIASFHAQPQATKKKTKWPNFSRRSPLVVVAKAERADSSRKRRRTSDSSPPSPSPPIARTMRRRSAAISVNVGALQLAPLIAEKT